MHISKTHKIDIRDKGMTILEVVLALSLLMICMTFILRSNFTAYKFTAQIDVQQQLAYFAQGALEAALKSPYPTDYPQDLAFVNAISDPSPPYNTFSISEYTATNVNAYLQQIKITVSSSMQNINSLTIYTYRLIPQS